MKHSLRIALWFLGLAMVIVLAVPSWARSSSDAKRCYEKLNSNLDSALHYCTAAIQSGRLSKATLAITLYYRGVAYITGKGDYERAIQDYDQAIRLRPNFAVAFYNRGIAYRGKGDYDRAIQDFDQAIRLKPDFAVAFYNRGIAHRGKGNYDWAIRDYDQAVRLKPDFAAAFNDRGIAYRGKGDYDRAIQDFDQAVRLKPDFALAFLRRRGI